MYLILDNLCHKIYIKYSFKENIPNPDNMNDEFNILMFEFNPDNRKMSESTLPEHIDVEFVNNLLLKIRKQQLGLNG